MNEDLYRTAMDGICQKVALQEIRKVIRGNKPEGVKLEQIVSIIHGYEEDMEQRERDAERRAIEEEEEAERRERSEEFFEGLTAPLDKLMDCVKGEKHDK